MFMQLPEEQFSKQHFCVASCVFAEKKIEKGDWHTLALTKELKLGSCKFFHIALSSLCLFSVQWLLDF